MTACYDCDVETIYTFLAKQRDGYRSDKITITEGYDFSQYETLRRESSAIHVVAWLNSITDQVDIKKGTKIERQSCPARRRQRYHVCGTGQCASISAFGSHWLYVIIRWFWGE